MTTEPTAFLQQPLQSYLDRLAAKEPIPGGGSVAALTGALAAGLLSMVANFTVGKEKYQAVEAEVGRILLEAESLRAQLGRSTEEDSEAYAFVSSAYALPKATDEEKAARSAAIQDALRQAVQIPVQVALACHRVIELSCDLVDKGNPGLVSDVGVAVVLAQAALHSAVLNVEVNLGGIKDAAFSQALAEQVEPLLGEVPEMVETVLDRVNEIMRG
jgi:formiminotetrahydrofolate cyclodeaminase